MKAKKEVELAILEKTMGKDNFLLNQARLELSEIQKKIDQVPEAGVSGLRLFRNVAIQQKILEFLLPLFEQTKVEEKRSTPSVIILDKASVPERKAKPKVLLYTMLAFVVSLFIALFIVFAAEGLYRVKALDPERYNRILTTIRSDWFGLRFLNRRK